MDVRARQRVEGQGAEELEGAGAGVAAPGEVGGIRMHV